MNFFWILFIIITFFHSIGSLTAASNHKIVYFISPPRSLSTAFMRMMQARGDFEIFNEPSQKAHALIRQPETVNSMFREEGCKTFDDVKKQLYEYAKKRNVFAKEMGSVVKNFLKNNLDFVQNPDVHFVFMIRDPHHSMISHYKRIKHIFNRLSFWGGFESEFEILQLVKEKSPNKPIILLTENLCNHPEETIKTLCNRLKIPYKAHALQWKDLGNLFTGQKEWHEIKYTQFTYLWHGDAIHSTCLRKLTPYLTDRKGNPTFTEISEVNYRKRCFEAYAKHMIMYKKFMNEKEYIIRAQ